VSPKLGKVLAENPGDSNKEERDLLASVCFMRKHKGATWRQVLDEDPDYIRWILFESDVKLGERLRDELMLEEL
jgi:hypothetical protein